MRLNNRWTRIAGLMLVALALVMLRGVVAQESTGADESASSSTTEGTGSDETQQGDQQPKPRKREKKVDDFDVKSEDWGSYYDPQNVFCGKYDCYKILGFDYESYNAVKPTTKEITKRYRRLGREWHPDKSKHKNAKDRFVKIARAYEVLTSVETRKEYDDLRYDQEAYVHKYGSSVIWKYAPQTDVTIVILIVLIVANVASWYAQKHRWSLVADRLIKAAVEDWLPKDGGTEESKLLREEALEILAKQQAEANGTEGDTADATTPANNGTSVKPGKKGKAASAKKDKANPKDKKKAEQEALLPIITALVNEMNDFGGGFHKPTWRDLVIVHLAKLPITIGKETVWLILYYIRRLQKLPLTDEEKEMLTSRAVGPVVWTTATDEDRAAMIQKELWITANLIAYQEEQEIKKLSATEQKLYYKLKKKGQLEKNIKSE